MATHQAPLSLGFSRQEHWSGLSFPSPVHESEKWKWSCSVVSDSLEPMNRSTPGFPVHHQLPEFTQTHVHRVSDAIQPSHPRSSPFPPAPNPSQQSFPMSQLFAWGGQSTGVSALASFLPKKSQGWSPSVRKVFFRILAGEREKERVITLIAKLELFGKD